MAMVAWGLSSMIQWPSRESARAPARIRYMQDGSEYEKAAVITRHANGNHHWVSRSWRW
jgi:hypothetical protein